VFLSNRQREVMSYFNAPREREKERGNERFNAPSLIVRVRELESDGARKRLASHDLGGAQALSVPAYLRAYEQRLLKRQYYYRGTTFEVGLSFTGHEEVCGIELDTLGGIQCLPFCGPCSFPPAT
jgi:hypothetical protein